MRRLGTRIDAFVAGAVLAGIPVVLLIVVGSPLGLASGGRWVTQVVADLVWLLWAWCLLGVLLSTASRVRRRDLDAAAGGRLFDSLSLRLATLVLALVGLLAPSGTATALGATGRVRAAPIVQLAPAVAAPAAAGAAPTYRVEAGDCLWSIAEDHYGEGADWVLIAWANLGHVMTDGRVFIDPSLIQPGWELALPSIDPVPAAPPTPSPAASATDRAPSAEVSETSAGDRAATHQQRPARASTDAAVVIASTLGAGAALLGLLRRRRRRLGALDAPEAHDEELLDADVALARLEPLPSTSLLERAALLAHADGVLEQPGLLEVGEAGARLWVEGRERWSAPACDLLEAPGPTAAPGAVLPLGEEGSTIWSLVVPPGTTATIDGPEAAVALATALALQAEFAWASARRR